MRDIPPFVRFFYVWLPLMGGGMVLVWIFAPWLAVLGFLIAFVVMGHVWSGDL